MSKSNGKARPPIDRTAEEAQTSPHSADVDRFISTMQNAPEDVPMDSAENEPGSVFIPRQGIGSLDVFELALMYLLEMTNSQIQVSPGALRGIQLSPHRVAQLSESARRFMVPLPRAEAPSTDQE